jgi:HAD superfamily hydrolase (TIGR01509 family)
MDGTVVDSEPSWFLAQTILVERFGGTWTARQSQELTGSDLTDAAAVLRAQGVDLETDALVNALLDIVIDEVCGADTWMPGAREAVQACREDGLRCALVSMSWSRFTGAINSLLPGVFDAVVSGDDVVHGKPDPEAYLLAAAKLGLDPSQCVAVEDSPTGVASAVAAGLPVIAIPAGKGVPGGHGVVVVDSARRLTVGFIRDAHRRLSLQEAA